MFKEFKNCTSVPAPSVKVYPAHASNFDFIFVIILDTRWQLTPSNVIGASKMTDTKLQILLKSLLLPTNDFL